MTIILLRLTATLMLTIAAAIVWPAGVFDNRFLLLVFFGD